MRRAAPALFLLIACGGPADEPLVQVLDVAIGERELQEYVSRLPDGLRPDAPGGEAREEAVRGLLQSLVDRELMLAEARALGYGEEPGIKGRLRTIYVRRLREQVQAEALGDPVSVGEEEIEEAYLREGWDRKLRIAHISCATEAEAQEVARALGEGADFAELAEQRSAAPDAGRGGDLGRYLGPGELPGELWNAVRRLAPGEVAGPLAAGRGFELLTVLDTVPVSVEEAGPAVGAALKRRKEAARRQAWLEELERRFEVAYHPEAVVAMARAARRDSGAGLDPDAPALTWAGGRELSAREAGRILAGKRMKPPALADSASVARALRHWVIADTVAVLEAERRGLHETGEFTAAVELELKRLLVNQVRRREVLDKVGAPGEEELRERYEEIKGEFTLPASVEVIEILAESAHAADSLRQRIEAGADMEKLARDHSVRRGAADAGGHFHLNEGEREKWGRLLDIVLEAEEGALLGPLEVEGGFTVVRVGRQLPARPRSFEELTPVLRRQVRQARNSEAFQQYIEGLRDRYGNSVEWRDERIGQVELNWRNSREEQ